jgi:Flp pilus assembly pilin Flp
VSSWFLLVIVSFLIVATLKQVKGKIVSSKKDKVQEAFDNHLKERDRGSF